MDDLRSTASTPTSGDPAGASPPLSPVGRAALRVSVPAPHGSRRRSGPRDLSRDGRSVPLSVWLSEPLAGCCRRCEQSVSAACAERVPPLLAEQIVDAYSREGDIVFAPDAGNAALLVAAVRAGRKVLGLVRGSDQGRRAQQELTERAAEVASLAIIRNAPNPGDHSAQGGRIAERAALAVISPHDPVTARELAGLLDATQRALRPGGVLAVTCRQSSGQDTAGLLVAFARAAGFTYLQHIAAVESAPTEDRLLPQPAAGHGPGCACPAGERPVVQAVQHNDVLVFTRNP